MGELPELPLQALASDLRVLIGKLSRRMRDEAHLGDFTWSQLKVLIRLERDGPATVSTLAEAEGMRPQSMGATIAALKAAGFVSGSPDPKDGRQTLLSLTAACRKAIKAGRAKREDWLLRTLQTRFSPAEQKTLAKSLLLLERLTDR